ncbi:MAG: translation elongation factor Ts [Phascolarctobacterium sp.]|nr:translation elongation factor Ts [Phascolarctobacterium sp.]
MAQITAALVKDLRERTGAGMMDCKKALSACDGDMDKAIDFLREKGLAAAAKKAGRIAAEGVVGSFVCSECGAGAIVEVNCETDFVAKTDNFKALVASIAEHIVKTNPADVDALLASDMGGKTVQDVVTEAIAKIGEKITVRRFARYENKEGVVAAYIHMGGKIGVLVNMNGGNAELGKDIAMQVAAANPSYLNRTQVPTAELEHEKEVLAEKAKNEGKPANIIEKMLIGQVNKYYKQVCLVDQEYVKDGDLTVGKLLKQNNADVTEFTRFQMGEGLEKRQDDFAAEVMAQVKA